MESDSQVTSHDSRSHFLGLPHRPPFVFVREVVRCEAGHALEARTVFEPDDPMFAGHFPGNPIVPGVILTEALAQTSGIAAASGYPENARPFFLLSAIRRMKFLRPVRPGEQIELRAEKIAGTETLLQFKVEARVNGAVAAEGQLVLSVSTGFGENS
ncbi:MAG TPA: 3-hydroxyacyl-ACP dehydratase FabZ family protein [Chthoniobacterales bacterium]|jgi:3-hydroxyacyl-[acyl-carrier-protein] dehydratase|nr:3-hydroxyacyl-ACP dehydratase FabZ family protein [Chthoniobacterales bacterium]